MTEFYEPNHLRPHPVDVQVALNGRRGGGKTTLAQALWAAQKAGHLPGIRLCFDAGLAERVLTKAPAYPEMQHPLFVGVIEGDMPANPPLDVQVQELAEFIQGNFPKAVGPGGAIDSAIELINAQAGELRMIDSVLSRRTALDGIETRGAKIEHACREAGEAHARAGTIKRLEESEARNAELMLAVSQQRNKARVDLSEAQADRDAYAHKLAESREYIAKLEKDLARTRGDAIRVNGHVAEASATLEEVIAAVRGVIETDGPVKASPAPPEQVTVAVYVDDGRVFTYQVANAAKAREHSHAIVMTGYRHSSEDEPGVLEHYGPYRINKVKVTGAGITSMYYDQTRGT